MGGAATTYAMRRFQETPATRLTRALRETGLPSRRFAFVAPPVDMRDFVRSATSLLGVGAATRDRVQALAEARLGVALADLYAPRAARSLHAPLLVLHDEDDREVPLACGRALAHAWPGAELEVTRGLGHHRIVWDAGVTGTIAAFVAS
jgi:pimeloyl-ACP methyl ester carboxylesterase